MVSLVEVAELVDNDVVDDGLTTLVSRLAYVEHSSQNFGGVLAWTD